MNTIAPSVVLFLIAAALASPSAARTVSIEEHNAILSRAKLWHPVDTAALDILTGPESTDARMPGAELKCRFAEKDPSNPITGHTPKFRCTTPEGRLEKVKYDADTSREVFAEPAATRLFWALGFYAERLYSVKTVCENCPADPWKSYDTPRAARVFDPTTINRRLRGEPVFVNDQDGWSLDELDNIDEKAGGSSQAEIDAFKLLVVFVHHGDDTPNQQRLLCPEGDKDCAHPLAFVTDLGGTFGGRDYIPSYRAWGRKASLWKDKAKCVADFGDGTDRKFADPKIGEAGRKLLAGQLSKLSDKQVHDVFAAARFDLLAARDYPVVEPGGKSHPAAIDDWVKLFKKKRQEILDTRCPE